MSLTHVAIVSLRAVINLEACGNSGAETLFQSTSSEVRQETENTIVRVY